MPLFINFIAFQVGWFACVLGGAYGWPWAGTVTALVLIGWHLSRVAQPQTEAVLIVIAGLFGALCDSLLVSLGLTQFPSGTLIDGTAPHWIIAMWMLFATTLNVALRWLRQRWLLAVLFGAAGGPLAYYAGFKLGGVTFPATLTVSMIVLAVAWAIATPLLVACSERWDGTAEIRPQSA